MPALPTSVRSARSTMPFSSARSPSSPRGSSASATPPARRGRGSGRLPDRPGCRLHHRPIHPCRRRADPMSDLRITGIEVDLVRWPLKMKRRHGVGDVERTMPGVIVKLVTDGGIAGWGEAAPWAVFTGTAEANALAIHHYLRPLLIGADPFDLTRLMAAADHALVGHGEAKAAIEMALFDIAG